jgi:small subunit ribosomal protein S19
MNDEFKFKGKDLAELKTMSTKEFSELLKTRERRSLNRGFTDAQKCLLAKLEKKDNVKTHCREMIILPNMVGKTIRLYNGKEFLPLKIVEDMLGHRIGEYIFTRKRVAHSSPGVGATRSSASVSVR